MTRIGRIHVAAALCLAATPAAAMIDLPVNERTLTLTYVYCLTGDLDGAEHVLAQRMEFVGIDASEAREWVREEDYCGGFLASAREAAPRLERGVTRQLREAGFDPNVPFSEQDPEDDGDDGATTQASIFKKIGKFLAGLFSGGGGGPIAGGEGHYTKVTSPDGTVTETCDRSWHIGKNKFEEAAEPIPFNPNPDGT